MPYSPTEPRDEWSGPVFRVRNIDQQTYQGPNVISNAFSG